MDKKVLLFFLIILISRSINKTSQPKLYTLKTKLNKSRIILKKNLSNEDLCFVKNTGVIIYKSTYCFNKYRKLAKQGLKENKTFSKNNNDVIHLIFTPSKKQKAKVNNNGLFIKISIPIRNWGRLIFFST